MAESAVTDKSELTLARFVLPVSGLAVTLTPPTGAEELLLAERSAEDAGLALALVERLAHAETRVDWASLTITDIDALIARLRIAVVGDRVIGEAVCASPGCGEKVDLSFRLSDWLAHHRPRAGAAKGRDWRTEPDPETQGWRLLMARGAEAVRFRPPTVADQIAIQEAADPALALAQRVLRPADLPARLRAKAEAAMEMMAPTLSGPMRGQCPHCGSAISALFQARHYCLSELRDRAKFVYEEIDALAERYHWSERAILRLPTARRSRYAARARQAQAA